MKVKLCPCVERNLESERIHRSSYKRFMCYVRGTGRR